MRRSTVGILLGAALVLFTCAGFTVPLDFAISLTLGWIAFLWRVLPQVHVNASRVANAILCLCLFAGGAHLFLRWFFHRIQDDAGPRRVWKPRWTGFLVASVVLMFAAGLATTGIAHQVGWLLSAKDRWFDIDSGGLQAARRAQSVNNLKQLGLGLHSYHNDMETFPPGGTFDALGQPLHSWQTRILPYVEQTALYNQINLQLPWDDLHNQKSFASVIDRFLNPGVDSKATVRQDAGYGLSHYAANVHVLGGNAARPIKEITDGTTTTIMAGEVPTRFKAWGNPTNWRDTAAGLRGHLET